MNNVTPFTSLSLKLVGIILVLSSLVDYLLWALPFNPFESRWQITYINSVVEQGISPLVGIALILAAYWIDSNAGNPRGFFDLKMPLFIFASIFGLIFLLFVPLYLTNLHTVGTEAQEQISQRAAQAEQRLQAEFEQFKKLDENIQQIKQILDSGEIQGQKLTSEQRQQLEQQKQRLEGLKQSQGKPEEMDKKMNELQTQLRNEQLKQEKQAKTETLKQGLRISLSSLMLAIGYSAIGWLGLKNSLGNQTPRLTSPKR